MMEKVVCDDAENVMAEMSFGDADLIVTDPPYGIDFQSARRTENERFDKIEGDTEVSTDFISEAYRILNTCGAMYLFTRWDVMPAFLEEMRNVGFDVKNCIVWDRGVHGLGDLEGAYAPRHDFILFGVKGNHKLNGNRPKDVIREQRVNPEDLQHPTEKPVPLLRRLIKNSSSEGDMVFDPFAGSGSTLVAAKQLGREAFGVEIKEKYVEIARDRLNKQSERLDMFV